jgi:hypothetical protein
LANNIAPYLENGLAGIRLRMCRLTFAPLDPSAATLTAVDGKKGTHEKHSDQMSSDAKSNKEKAVGGQYPNENDRTIFDDYIDGMQVGCLNQAYVLIIPKSNGNMSIEATPDDLILCRTAEDGELLRIAEGDIGSGVPESCAATWLPFSFLSSAEYYWTLSRRRFRHVLKDVKSDLDRARKIHDFGQFIVAPEEPKYRTGPAMFELLESYGHRGLIEAVLSAGLLKDDVEDGFYDGWDLNRSLYWGQQLKYHNRHLYIFARRKAADTIYRAELTRYHALGLRQRGVKDYALASQVRGLHEQVDTFAHVPWVPADKPVRAEWEEYYRYAWNCARDLRVERELFVVAVDVRVSGSTDWILAATEILKATEGKCVHPSYPDEKGFYLRNWQAPTDVFSYFDYYRLPLKPNVTRAFKHFGQHETYMLRWQEGLRKGVNRMLSGLHYYDLLVCDGAYPADCAWDIKLQERFFHLAFDVDFDWTEDLKPEDKRTLEALKPYLEDIATSSDKLTSLYNMAFNNTEAMKKYYKLLEGSSAHFESWVKKMSKWNAFVEGKTVKLRNTTEFQVKVNYDQMLIEIKDAKNTVIELDLYLASVDKVYSPSLHPRSRSARRKLGLKKPQLVNKPQFELKPQFAHIAEWPFFLGNFGQMLALAMSVSELLDVRTEAGDSFVALVRVTKDAFQLITGVGETVGAVGAGRAARAAESRITSGGEAITAMERYAIKKSMASHVGQLVKEAGEKLNVPGLVLEGVLNVVDGVTIVRHGMDSTSRAAAMRGEEVEATVEDVKGYILILSPAPGVVAAAAAAASAETADLVATAAVEAIAAAALGAVATPLAVGLAIAGAVIVLIDIGLYIHSGPQNVMQEVEDKLMKAAWREFGEYYEISKTNDAFDRFSSTVDLLTTKTKARSYWRQ